MQSFPENWRDLNVVLSHDWLTGMRGGERVLEILCEGFPNAPIYTLIHHAGAISASINSHRIQTSWLQSVPGIFRYYRNFLPCFPGAVERMPTPKADLLISTSHCVAKGLKPQPGTRHLCYCFTPMRYAWTFFDEYFGGNPVKAAAARLLIPGLRRWDRDASARVDRFVAISRHVQTRIRDFYGRESDVVYPPVATDQWTPAPDGQGGQGGFDLIVSALVPYKRVDLAVRAYTQSGFPLKIVGIGGDVARLKAMAGTNVEFMGWRSDAEILGLYRACRLLVFPGEEDFGIVPLEAQACGRPVVAFRKGGVLESVNEGETGVFFDAQTEESLLDAVTRSAATRWDPVAIRRHAESFGVARFIRDLDTSLRACMASV